MFACQEVEYLDHIIAAEGLKPNPERVEAVKQFKEPYNLLTVHQFLGLTSFYRRFVPAFAQITSPLHELTKKEVPFAWTTACQTSFEQLKGKLVEAPVLRSSPWRWMPAYMDWVPSYHKYSIAGHFSGVRLYKTLPRQWWWDGMYKDALSYCKNCPQYAVVSGQAPPLKPIPVERVFQIVGVDIMELLKTRNGNWYVVVFQDYLSKWPFLFATKNQKATTLAKLLVEEVVPVFGVPEALLSDRGTNLLSHLM